MAYSVATEAYDEGARLMESERYEEALVAFNEAVLLCPLFEEATEALEDAMSLAHPDRGASYLRPKTGGEAGILGASPVERTDMRAAVGTAETPDGGTLTRTLARVAVGVLLGGVTGGLTAVAILFAAVLIILLSFVTLGLPILAMAIAGAFIGGARGARRDPEGKHGLDKYEGRLP